MKAPDLLATMWLLLPISACDDSAAKPPPTAMTEGGTCAPRSKHYEIGADIPIDAEENSKRYPECVPTCGQDRVDEDGFPSIESLPFGDCTDEPTCTWGAYSPCPCDTGEGPVSEYKCSCNDGKWSCTNISVAASSCTVECADDAGA